MRTKKLFEDVFDHWIIRRVYWVLVDKCYSIRNFFFPRQRWLLRRIPDHHVDIDHLIEIILTECLLNYVESELKWTNFNEEEFKDYPDHELKFYKELWVNYLRIKKDLPALKLQEEAEWERIGNIRDKLSKINSIPSYQEIYGKIDEIEKEIDDLKTKVFIWLVSNRAFLWT